LAKAKKPMIVLGSVALQRSDKEALYSAVRRLADKVHSQNKISNDWRVFNVLHRVNDFFIFKARKRNRIL
jgi:NADH dehydrogenase (ubiquinone) Fe-S protein 1